MKMAGVPNRSRGFSILEVLVSLSLFGIFAGAMLPSFANYMKRIHETAAKTEAIAVAARKFDELREQGPDAMPAQGTFGPESLSRGRRTFQVYTTYCAIAAFCPSTRTRHIRVDVRYRGRSIYSADSVYTRLR